MAMRCHARVAQRSAWMQLPEITLGILPGIGAMVVPYRRWPGAAKVFHGMLARAERLSAARAHDLGVVDELADDFDDLIRRAVARVHGLKGRIRPIADGALALPSFEAIDARSSDGRRLSATMVSLIEQAVHEAAAAPTLGQALEVGYRAFGAAACTAAAREGIHAFMEKRDADFATSG
jgi:enoyl-CoA hydratase/3-hydroxyacyl-CoA dehydrogenase